jgi:hypothetical protein
MTDAAKERLTVEIGRELARRVFAKRGNHSEAHVHEVELGGLLALAADIAITKVEEREKALATENEALRDWRSTVTAALGNPGGALYAEVPALLRALRRERDSLAFRIALAEAPTRIDGAPLDYDICNDPRD